MKYHWERESEQRMSRDMDTFKCKHIVKDGTPVVKLCVSSEGKSGGAGSVSGVPSDGSGE